MTRMKTIALIDTRLEVPGVSLGILVSTRRNTLEEAEQIAADLRAHHDPTPIRWGGLPEVIEPKRFRLRCHAG